MPLELTKEHRQDAIASLKQYFDQNMPEPIGDLAANLLLNFILEDIGPALYNQAIHDAQARLAQRVADLDSELYEAPFHLLATASHQTFPFSLIYTMVYTTQKEVLNMPSTAKLFKNGRSQAVRLPAEFRFEGTEVNIRRDPATGDVILSHKEGHWEEFFRLRDELTQEELDAFEIPRDPTPPTPRDLF